MSAAGDSYQRVYASDTRPAIGTKASATQPARACHPLDRFIQRFRALEPANSTRRLQSRPGSQSAVRARCRRSQPGGFAQQRPGLHPQSGSDTPAVPRPRSRWPKPTSAKVRTQHPQSCGGTSAKLRNRSYLSIIPLRDSSSIPIRGTPPPWVVGSSSGGGSGVRKAARTSCREFDQGFGALTGPIASGGIRGRLDT